MIKMERDKMKLKIDAMEAQIKSWEQLNAVIIH
jgi:hypothetical protein